MHLESYFFLLEGSIDLLIAQVFSESSVDLQNSEDTSELCRSLKSSENF